MRIGPWRKAVGRELEPQVEKAQSGLHLDSGVRIWERGGACQGDTG